MGQSRDGRGTVASPRSGRRKIKSSQKFVADSRLLRTSRGRWRSEASSGRATPAADKESWSRSGRRRDPDSQKEAKSGQRSPAFGRPAGTLNLVKKNSR